MDNILSERGKLEIQKRFIDNFKYFSEVVNNNTLIFGEQFILECDQHISDIKTKRKGLGDGGAAAEEHRIIIDPPWIQGKNDFYKYIIGKIKELQLTMDTHNKRLSYFYIYYRRVYDGMSISIIALASALSVTEAVSMCFPPVVYTKILTMCMSALITVLTSIIKLKNYKEKTEQIVKIREKVYMCQTNLYIFEKDVKSQLYIEDDNPPPP